ncbi:MAG: branched-chain amino acid aminotransferase [Ruminococcaceae bacterium]|nr:branched-chain amino acid aminotransferase [Oscillospiraceae bacterium]MBD5116975.1 branched-chain amino acid aminotransferase [Oscillospiraceae bacterium]
MEIKIQKTAAPKVKPDQTKLGFGNYYTDHMFIMNYDEGEGWHDARIVPYGPFSLDPAAMVLHYAQEIFEGLKAYRTSEGKIQLFRPEKNMARMNLSCERLCIPQIDEEFAIKAIKTLVKIDEDWIPTEEGTSLYIRPYIFAVDPHVGVHAAKHLIFAIILSPVGAYYPNGIEPVKIFVEQKYVRAVAGGTGFTKAGANYAISLKGQEEAEKQGYVQTLWLDGVERKYVEEVGSMNVFFIIGDEVVTPALVGSILGGITRMSIIELLRSKGYTVNERRLSIDELTEAYRKGQLKEAFGTGTAAVISPIGELKYGDLVMEVNGGKIGETSRMLYDTLTGIQWGRIPDTMGWIQTIE